MTDGPGGGGGYSQKNWVGVCDISCPIYDLTKNWKPYLRPYPQIKTQLRPMLNYRKHNL